MLTQRVERVLPYNSEMLFDIAADVERYPEYLPWWIRARVTMREADRHWTDQTITFGPLRARFSSLTVLCRPERIDVTSREPPFRRFDLSWTFDPVPEGGARVSLMAQFELRSALLEQLVAPSHKRVIAQIIAAFEARAAFRLGSRSGLA